MNGEQYSDTSGGSAGAARYTHGHGAAVLSAHSRRGAEDSAAYLLGRLRAGMNLLDVGCGPATITADLAEHVAPAGSWAWTPLPAPWRRPAQRWPSGACPGRWS